MGLGQMAGRGGATARYAADVSAARRRQGLQHILRETGQRLGPGRAREQHPGLGTSSRGLAIAGPL
jgi:hypothetical protein